MSNSGTSFSRTSGASLFATFAVACALPQAVWAQAWFVQPVISSTVTATSNSGYTTGAAAESDVIVNVSPGIVVRGGGPRFKVDGSFYLDALGYVNDTQTSTVLPRGAINTNSTLVERLLFLDASFSAVQTSQTPFGARPDGLSSYNTETTTQARVNPIIRHEFSQNVQLNAYANNTWLHTSNKSGTTANARDNAYVQDQFLSIERKPVPFGAELQVAHQDTRYANQDFSALTIDNWRAVVSYAFVEQVQVGLIGGHERDRVPYGEVTDSIVGLNAKWRPSERTKFDATLEDRFFGLGWDAQFEHRTPFQAWNLRLIRRASTYASSLASLPTGGNVESLLDATFTTRYPDPVERSRVVQEVMASRGLPSTLSGPVEIYTEAAQMEQSATATYLITGVRDSLACSYYFDKRGPLPIPGSTDPLQSLLSPANSQYGLALQYSHRLTPLMTLDALARWSRLEGHGSTEGNNSRDKVYRAGLNWMLAPQSTGSVGLRWQQHRSNVSADAEETALYMGLDHRF